MTIDLSISRVFLRAQNFCFLAHHPAERDIDLKIACPYVTVSGVMKQERPPASERFIIERYKTEGLSVEVVSAFRECVWTYYREHGRALPWRETRDAYKILVSEIMLQQTQVPRVIAKYHEFLDAFPDIVSLATAPLRDVLSRWQGLGYNRRAVALKKTAEIVVRDFGGELPRDEKELRTLPGIGSATAAALSAFVFGKALPFIETNIRSVFIHFFFGDKAGVPDRELIPLVEQTLACDNPREWYYALMDYGAMLKNTHPNPSRRSAHHKPQSSFEGSHRQLRANALRVVLERDIVDVATVAYALNTDPSMIRKVLDELENEGFVSKKDGAYSIKQ